VSGIVRNRRKIKSAVLIDRPVKDKIAVIEANKKVNVKKRIFSEKKEKSEKANGKKPKTNETDEITVLACVA
jgi:hypothetical protein